MTTRLYYDDPYLTEFDASVTSVQTRDGNLIVTLDRTAFYPTSGGQPFDTGTLAGVAVVDVVDRDDGVIEHILKSAVGSLTFEAGAAVRGEIDWTRRFDHMQQHTGQHVLSAAFDRLFHIRTVSFHLGADVSTIDLARDVSQTELTAAEQDANRVVWEDRAVAIRYATDVEAAAMPLRKEPKRGGTLRLIDIADVDLSACGGTHVARTGAIGIIAIPSWERFKGGVRVEFLCGGRALRRFRELRDSVNASTRLLSVSAGEVPHTVERMQADAKAQKRTIAALQTELARFHAEELAASAESVSLRNRSSARFVARALDADANTLKALASAVTAQPGFVVVLLSTAVPSLIVVARSADLAGVNAQQILAGLVGEFGGRGGGKPELAQGGGLNGSAQEILKATASAL
jgi:alanyl-tRNA synthetase